MVHVHTMTYLVARLLSHGVEGAAVLEPLNLALVEGVRERDRERLAAIGGVDGKGDGLAGGELSRGDADLVVGSDLLVVGGVAEGQRKHTLLLQVGLVLCNVSKNDFVCNAREYSRYERKNG